MISASRLSAIAVLAAIPALAGAATAERTLKGAIVAFDCGDNCYLTIRSSRGQEMTALCVAKACALWNDAARMPPRFIGRKVTVTVGRGLQFAGEGEVAGEMDAFKTLLFDD